MDEFELPNAVPNFRPSYMEPVGDDSSTPLGEFDSEVVKNIEDELDEVKNVEGSERIRTFLRIRAPSTKYAKLHPDAECQLFEVESPTTLLVKQELNKRKHKGSGSETRFTFSQILGPERSQSSVFEECVHPILEKFFEGENCLVFSYGATNSGKTYTMQGYGSNFGIVPRTLEYLYNRLEESLYTRGDIKPNQFDAYCELDAKSLKLVEDLKQKILQETKLKPNIQSFRDSCASSTYSISSEITHHHQIKPISSGPVNFGSTTVQGDGPLYSIWISFAEVYNERVYDLFEIVQKGKKRKEMKLYQDKRGQVYINGLTECTANNSEEAYHLFLAGRENLQFASTQMNNNSSRSHSFFNIRMVSLGVKEGFVHPMKVFRLSFCDLAGVERISETNNVGVRLRESGSINQSLLVLLRCIRAMRDKQQGKATCLEVLPYRESKLARLFKSYLTSATHIRMIVTINPSPIMLDSTMQVLINSAVASKVQLCGRVEAPVYNTNFCRKIRDSLGLITPIPEASENDDTLDDNDVETIGDSNGHAGTENNDSSVEYADTTIETNAGDIEEMPTVKKCEKVIDRLAWEDNLMFGGKDLRLKENVQLHKDLFELTDRIRCNIVEKCDEAYNKNSIVFKNLLDDTLRDTYKINAEELYWKMEAFKKEPHRLFDSDILRKRAIRLLTQIPSTSKEIATSKVGVNRTIDDTQDYKYKYTESCQNVKELEALLEEKAKQIVELEIKARYPPENYEEAKTKLESQQSTIRLLMEENVKMRQEQSSLATELEKERKDSQEKEKEAFELCQSYHKKLEEANDKIVALQEDYNILNGENIRLKEDKEFLHITMDDMESKNTVLEAKLAKFVK